MHETESGYTMRLAVIGDELSQDVGEVVRACVRHGFDGVEVRSVDGEPPHRLTTAHLSRISETVRTAGLDIAAFASPMFKTPLPGVGPSVREQRELLRRAIDVCLELAAPTLRVFSFLRERVARPAAAADALLHILEGVELFGVALAVETGTRTNTPTARHLREMLDLVADLDIVALWDPGNSVFAGFDTGPVPGGLGLLWPGPLRHVHVKDPDGTSGYVALGEGDIDWPQLLRTLRGSGFAGWVSLETHWRIGRELTAAQRDEPWGAQFSAGGYEATDACMATLARWAHSP